VSRHQRREGRVLRGRELNSIAGAALALLLLAACGADTAQPSPEAEVRELINPTDMGYASASRYGDLVWTAGHLPFDVAARAPIEDQVNAVLDDLEVTLEAAGAGFDNLIKTNVYLIDFNDWETFNAVYVARIGADAAPPRTTVQVAQLGHGLIEIEMVAHVRATSP
jgi:2-iminobutanoate/2-iminopropanoate deaminase